ncbi:MAG: MBL fold metallo-hydrolase [Kofleriaceae bacterium]|nr:MBL fold metallo-hydrolase [Kofleriaceae bacterium]
MKVRFWGVRGSFATPGEKFLRYGGNTTSIEVRADSGHRVLIDLGTGITEFAKELMAAEFGQGKGILPVLLTHTHVDHIQGLPFFTPFFIRGNSIQIYGAENPEMPLEKILQGQLNGHYSPLYGLQNLAAGVAVTTLAPGDDWDIDGFEVKTAQMSHGSTTVMSYRITADGKSVVIMPDVEHGPEGLSENGKALAMGCDLLIHDAMFSDGEYALRSGWGHSSVSSAIATATATKAKRLALFHHSPDADDDAIDTMVAHASAACPIPLFAAQEGCDIVL